MRPIVASLGFFLVASAFASDGNMISEGDAAERALQQSQLTLLGSKPFHMQAFIRETTDPNSDDRAEIDEYWVSPTK